MDNPFTTAEWGAIYDLAGAKWSTELLAPKYQPDSGIVVIGKHLPSLMRVSKVWGKFNYDNWRNTLLPLLPSPAFVNAQTNPRAVAIAALERAGFDQATVYECGEFDVSLRSVDGEWCITVHADDGSYLHVDTNDPAIARYAQDCFEVLHAWAAAINWEVHDDT